MVEGRSDGGSGWSEPVTGTQQGSVISPLLANVYLHYGFDLKQAAEKLGWQGWYNENPATEW